jgi:hypothetical protein
MSSGNKPVAGRILLNHNKPSQLLIKETRHCTPGVLPQDGFAIFQGAAKRGNLVKLAEESFCKRLPRHCVPRNDGVVSHIRVF